MKPETIKVMLGQIEVRIPASIVATAAMATALSSIGLPPAANTPTGSPPALGEYWPGEGGIYGGKMQAREGNREYHMVLAADDLGELKWGGYREESTATSKHDGYANTQTLLQEGDHPAASACAKYTADNHDDFYLPAAAELYEAWLNIPEKFAQMYHWSSSQRSAGYALGMAFSDGLQNYYGKYGELRVRPVRRVFI